MHGNLVVALGLAAGALHASYASAASPSFVQHARRDKTQSTLASTAPPPIKILQGTFTSQYHVLFFNPYANPPTLKVAGTFNTSDGYIQSWMNFHPNNPNMLIACDSIANGDGYMASYAINPSTGELSFLDAAATKGTRLPGVGASTAHCAFYQDGKVAAAANYGSQSVPTYRFDPNTGKFGEKINTDGKLDFSGYKIKPGQNPDNQQQSHPHQVFAHPFLPFVYIPDLGADLLRVFPVKPEGTFGKEVRYEQKTGSGPRHATVTADGKHLYLVHEMAATVSAYKIDQITGRLHQIQRDISILPGTAIRSKFVTGAEIYASNDGRYLYTSSRNATSASGMQQGDPDDLITVFSIKDNGRLVPVEYAMAPHTRVIRGFKLSQPGNAHSVGGEDYLIAGGQNSNDVVTFKRNKATGKLDVLASLTGVEAPSTFLWLG